MERVMKEALLLLMVVILAVSIISILSSSVNIRENLYYKRVDFWKMTITSINQKYRLEGEFTPPER
ncbi:MAG: hypothetical protein ACP5JF_03320 [Candidatus Methanodesulfokora sp.]|jgi:cell division protein FtsW (lipid II flippase)